jgi:hypothetical protein
VEKRRADNDSSNGKQSRIDPDKRSNVTQITVQQLS